MRLWALVLVAACSKDARDDKATPRPALAPGGAPADAKAVAPADAAASVAPSADGSYPDLGTAIRATVPADARVVGFGELHSRTDRAQVKSSLSRFTTDALPAIGDKLSDLVVETWIVDKQCGSAAEVATAKVTTTVKRPQETKSEIAELAEVARKAGIQPHAMHVGCEDYARVAPAGKEVKLEEMLALTTRELGRIAVEAIAQRDAEPGHRPWIAVYGGALHNDRFPQKGVEDWSYAAKVDAASKDHFVEIDLIVPELAEADAASQKQPWFDLVKTADKSVHVWKRGDRSFVIVLTRTPG